MKILRSREKDIFQNDIVEIAKQLKHLAGRLEGKTLVITGGSGFLGKYLVETIAYLNKNALEKKCKIISVDNYITSTSKHQPKKGKNYVKYIKHDVTKPLSILGKIDYIMHAAGIASPVYYQKYPLQTIDVAVTGARNMLELARKKRIKSLVYFSSSEIYGNPAPNSIPTKESYKGNVSSTGPRACYDESKRLGETLCMVYHRLYKTPIKIVRPFNIFGPGMNHQDYRVIPTFIYNALNNKPLPVHVSGKQTRTFCYISNAIVGFFKVLLSDKSGEIYNIGNDKNEINMNQLAHLVNRVFDNKLEIKNVGYPKNYPPDEPRRRCPDLSKIKKDLKYKVDVDLEEGLRRTVIWCKENWI